MNRAALISFALVFFALVPGAAQPALRYDNVSDRNFALGGTNAAFMRSDSVNISFAQIGAQWCSGENRRSSDAPRQWEARADASTIMHLDKFSMAGSFGFSQTMLYDACGSMLDTPGKFPVDLLEYTPGTKSRQHYSFDGAISVDLDPSWRVGGKVAFDAVNCAKRKDLRYTNYAMDLSLRAGAQWISGDFSLGASLSLERSTETVTAEQVGESVEPYYAFLDKGLHYGVNQDWEGGGVHLKESGVSGFPIAVNGFGGALQASWKELYADISYVRSNGRIGDKDAVWFRFPTDRIDAILGWKTTSARGAQHILRLDAQYRVSCLDENVIEKVTQGGVTTRRTYGSNIIQRSDLLSLAATWKMLCPGSFEASFTPSFRVENGVGTMQYPFVNARVLRVVDIPLEARKHFGALSTILRLGIRKGFLDDSSYAVASVGADSSQYRQTEYFESWKWWETTLCASAGLGIRYEFSGGLYLQADVDISVRERLARLPAGLKFGYKF